MFSLNDMDRLLGISFSCFGPDMIGGHDSIRSIFSIDSSLSSSLVDEIEPIENDDDCAVLTLNFLAECISVQ
jgi:hypothetical protein